MQFEAIVHHVSQHIQLDKDELEYFKSLLKEVNVPRKEFIQHQGKACSYINFVESGLLRAFHINPDGKESTVMFAIENWWITDMYCFLNEQPSMTYIQAVKRSKIFRLSRNHLHALFDTIPQFNTFFRILMQNAYCREQLRMIQNLSLPAKERYENFVVKYPQITQNVTQKQIASYLGITPEFLSSIRGEQAKSDHNS